MSAAGWVRPPAVAGLFYDEDPAALGEAVAGYIEAAAHRAAGPTPAPKAIIAPHAGYVYSGPVAGSAYARLSRVADRIERVVLVGPAHRVPVDGLAVSGADAFETPLGAVPVDSDGRTRALQLPQVSVSDRAHAPEHSLEVHLPFLQRVLDRFVVLPLVAGRATPDEVADVLEVVWGGDETLVVVSTDLSHYHDHRTAVALDHRTAGAVVAKRPEAIGDLDACGAVPVRGLLVVADRRGLDVELLDLRTSHDTAGPPDRVVGYGAFALSGTGGS